MTLRRLHVLVTGTSSDAHTWNLIFLQLALEEAGHDVTNLGPCVPDDLLTETCVRLRPDALVISSVNGHGHADAARAAAVVRHDSRHDAMPIIVGGLLGTAGNPNAVHAPALEAAGVTAVLEKDDLPELMRLLAEIRTAVAATPAAVAAPAAAATPAAARQLEGAR
ncbi:cobalamin B12-binding domain-containing protein [Salinispora sp. H7-4]|uniref:cobalamin B12-binding domain-containing protein n=1 Tax=Salinispora sp. H7-4 TaxID=2748321 RepID=UPI0015D2BD68|nr:cobalamin-dependent protein [Salinispora sp. H7-4]NYT94283.1 cobalamin B12-binding domain-containing protein [Salinispora sp. H7-4]